MRKKRKGLLVYDVGGQINLGVPALLGTSVREAPQAAGCAGLSWLHGFNRGGRRLPYEANSGRMAPLRRVGGRGKLSSRESKGSDRKARARVRRRASLSCASSEQRP